MNKTIIASNNQHKIIEFKQILSEKLGELISLKDAGIDIEIEETGTTFYENALIKAKTIAEKYNCIAISDDSGLCVDYLNGAPGVFSARFAGEPCNDENNNQLLLKKLETAKNRNAHYKCVIVLYNPFTKKILSGEGETYGHILKEYRGSNGFGYDPLFFSNDLNKTFAESNPEEKNLVSHRKKALSNLLDAIKKDSYFNK